MSGHRTTRLGRLWAFAKAAVFELLLDGDYPTVRRG